MVKKPITGRLWKNALSGLTQRERKVLKMRYGIDIIAIQTLQEVANEFKVGRERIRQIEYKAIRKLSHNIRREFSKRKENKWLI